MAPIISFFTNELPVPPTISRNDNQVQSKNTIVNSSMGEVGMALCNQLLIVQA